MDKNTRPIENMTQPSKTKSIDSQIAKIMALLTDMDKAKELSASVKFRNLLNTIYNNEVDSLEKMIYKIDKLPTTGGNTITYKEELK